MNEHKKAIADFDTALKGVDAFRSEGKKIVLCHGVFGALHIGHMRYLREARKYGDVLVAAVVPDQHIDQAERPEFNEHLRAEALCSLEWIDIVLVSPFADIIDVVAGLKPDVFVKGFESIANGSAEQNGYSLEKQTFREMGVQLVVAQENPLSTTSQINQYLSQLPEDIQKYIHLFVQRYSMKDLLSVLESMRQLKVLVVGDTILDEYQYCEAIGKSSKDPTLALKYESRDLFAGGVLAVANHIAGFVDTVDLITVLGSEDSHEQFIRDELKANINPRFFCKQGSPTLIKRRFIDSYSMNKLLEVYVMDDVPLKGECDVQFCRLIKSSINEYDIVVTADFGHGTVNGSLKDLLSSRARYLAVNAQSNAGNRGFNNVTKYSRADYVSIAEHEIRLEMRNVSGKIWPMIENLANRLKCRKFTVTRGRMGCMLHDHSEGGFIQVPSFAHTVVDRVGAGDAFFAVTALAAVLNTPSEILGFLGNVAGSVAVETMGNQKPIDRQRLIHFCRRLLGNEGL